MRKLIILAASLVALAALTAALRQRRRRRQRRRHRRQGRRSVRARLEQRRVRQGRGHAQVHHRRREGHRRLHDVLLRQRRHRCRATRIISQPGTTTVTATPVLNAGNGKQITGFNLTGQTSGFTTTGGTTLREDRARRARLMYMNLGQGDLFGKTQITGGLKVNGIDLPNTPVVAPSSDPTPHHSNQPAPQQRPPAYAAGGARRFDPRRESRPGQHSRLRLSLRSRGIRSRAISARTSPLGALVVFDRWPPPPDHDRHRPGRTPPAVSESVGNGMFVSRQASSSKTVTMPARIPQTM